MKLTTPASATCFAKSVQNPCKAYENFSETFQYTKITGGSGKRDNLASILATDYINASVSGHQWPSDLPI